MGARKNQETTPWHPGDGSNALAGMTYRSRLAFGTIDALSERLDSIERGLGVFNGVTTWCERCRMCSVLSYSSYLHTLRVSNSSEMPMARLDYYSHMCDLAERISGRRGIGFTVTRSADQPAIPPPPPPPNACLLIEPPVRRGCGGGSSGGRPTPCSGVGLAAGQGGPLESPPIDLPAQSQPWEI